jgi:beta-glucanase (GH16 family)
MTKLKCRFTVFLLTVVFMLNAGCVQATTSVFPASDPANAGNWILRADISDEFQTDTIDKKKWFVQGDNGNYYIWKGRAPSQFVAHNVLLEDGMLKIRTQWEPDYPFARESYADGSRNDTYGVWEGKPMPVTTAGVISNKRFLYGYMEVRTKAGNAAMTSSFWTIGYESELDIYEQMGNPKNKKGDIRQDMWKASVHDWSPPAKRPTRRFGLKTTLPFRVADVFHVYGAEWGEDYLKLFLDGELVYETTQAKEGKNWVLNNPLEIWFDSEIFVWLGLPHKEELPVDYEIDYVRVWQKPQKNLLAPQFFGFEGPILFEDNPKPLTLVPESSEVQEYQKFWEIGEHGMTSFSITKEQSARGLKSLKFDAASMLANVSAVTPAQAVDIPAGEYMYSMQVMMEEGCAVQALNVSLADPEVIFMPFDLSGVKKGQWVTLTQKVKRAADSGRNDRLRLRIKKADVKEGTGVLYIDDIRIEAARE